MSIHEKLTYLAELRQLAAVARLHTDYQRIVERIERLCDSIECDLGLVTDQNESSAPKVVKPAENNTSITSIVCHHCGGRIYLRA